MRVAVHPTRRDILASFSVASLAGAVRAESASIAPAQGTDDTATSQPAPLPRARLGKTGLTITRLGLGAGYPSYATRLLDSAYQHGIRYFDNGYGYGNGKHETILGEWIQQRNNRGHVVVATKDGICTPEQFYDKVTRSLERIRLDTIDLYLVHGLDDPGLPLDAGGEWQKLKQRLVRENKIRFMGFSTHAEMPRRIELLTNAARSKWVDVVMVATDPLMLRTNAEFSRAVDACAKVDLGLIAMKTTRGLGAGAARRRGVPEGQAKTEQMPGFDELGLSAFGAVHYGMWSDGRFAAVCSAMLNMRTLEENAANARRFSKPLNQEQLKLLEDGLRKLARATCPDCDGSCRRAAGTATDFCSIARFVAYAEEDGNRVWARQLYRELAPDARDASGANFAAASGTCRNGLDLADILRRAQHWFGEAGHVDDGPTES